ncbi:MAG: hydrogenase maturation protease [Bacteroidales bacterium]|nr:hydrogenase maturation protease [Bacteroidales bacterium]
MGNEIQGDDGIGIKIVKLLKRNSKNASIHYETLWVGGLDLIEAFDGYKIIIIIDGIKTGEKEPGFVWDLTPENFRNTLHLSNLHDLTFLEAIETGRQLGYKIPETIHILAIEIIEDLVFSNDFSTEVQACYQEIINTVENKIKEICLQVGFR